MGNTLYRMNKFNESIDAYKKALKLDPDDMDAKFNLEFVREQIKKKEEQMQKDKVSNDRKNQEASSQVKKNQNLGNPNKLSKLKKTPSEMKQNDDKPNEGQSDTAELKLEIMTKGEAEQKLLTLSENLKKFQRKQALDMKSLFNYQDNDW